MITGKMPEVQEHEKRGRGSIKTLLGFCRVETSIIQKKREDVSRLAEISVLQELCKI